MAQRDEVAVRRLLTPLRPWLDRDDIEDIAINRPGEVFVLPSGQGWQRYELAMDFDQCRALATAAATLFDESISAASPVLSVSLPDDERAQFVIPPAAPRDTVAISIRKPSATEPTMDDLESSGLFARVVTTAPALQQHEVELLELKKAGKVGVFLRRAIELRKTIGFSGPTGCGKTYIMKAAAGLIPQAQRVITIESVRELRMPGHPNVAHLFYSDTEREGEKATPKALLKAALRMRPDIILLTEVRADEAPIFVRVAASGHPGSMTSLQAGSCAEAWEQMALMILMSEGGAKLDYDKVMRLLHLTVDVIVQFGTDGCGRYVREIDYNPERKLALAAGSAR